MRRLFDALMHRRARSLAARIAPHLQGARRVLDIGCGTGHNANALRARCDVSITQVDVANFVTLGPPPLLFDGRRLPLADQSFEAGLMLFILHYPQDPLALLREARRVVSGPLIILQSTRGDGLSGLMLRCREFFQGRLAFWLARAAGLIRPVACPLKAREFMRRPRLETLFAAAGWHITKRSESRPFPGAPSRDLYILEPVR